MRIFEVFIMCLILFGTLSKSKAQTIFGAVSEGLGESGRAAVSALDAHFLNPAGLAYSRGTNVGGSFQEGDLSTPNPINNYSFEMTDNDPENIAAGGFAYVYKRTSFADHTLFDQDLSLSLSSHVTSKLTWGVQAHRFFRQNSNGPAYTKYNATAGLLAVPAPWFGLAFVVYDLFMDADQVQIPTFAVGAHVVILDIVRLRADVSRPELQNPTHTGILGIGSEFVLGSDLFARVGGEWNDITKQTYATFGVGFEGPKLNVGYAYRNNVNVDGDAFHTFQTWLTF